MATVPKKDKKPLRKRSALKDALVFTSLYQAIVLILASLITDGGGVFQLIAYASIAFWTSALVLLYRSKGKLTTINLLYLRYGVFLAYLLSICLCDLIWKFRGLASTHFSQFRIFHQFRG